MAEANVTIQLPVSHDDAWAVLSDLSRFGEWLTIHDKWTSELPAEVTVGTKITEQLIVMGMTNKVDWTVEEYQPPSALKIAGTGLAGAQISFTLSVAGDGDKSTVTVDASFTGQMMVGAIGDAVQKNATAELEKSLARLAEIVG
jgi:carbon monoxide dehydrogenase subunit G